LGRAFEGFNNDGLIYFPALTLSNNEHVAVNLGERPFKFPIQGAKPIISNPATLINYYRLLEKNISLLIDNQISILANVSLI
jgi:Kip1 ubiquitination-promoting complex protein 1